VVRVNTKANAVAAEGGAPAQSAAAR